MNNIRIYPWTHIPDYINPREMTTGWLCFDKEKCKRCGICTFICPARSIVQDKQPSDHEKPFPYLESMVPGVQNCIACGCCVAACPHGAIRIEQGFNPGDYYQRLTQSAKMTYPTCYQSDTQCKPVSSEVVTWPEPDPLMISPQISWKRSLLMRINRLKFIKNIVWGVTRFGYDAFSKGKLLSVFRNLVLGKPEDISWAQQLEYQASKRPDKPFLLYKEEVISYAQMNANANRIATYLVELGAGPGKGLGILMRNSPRFLDVFFASQKTGMYSVPVNPELRGEGLYYILSHSDIEYLFIDAELLTFLDPIIDQLPFLKKIVVNDVESEAQGILIPQTMESMSQLYKHMPLSDVTIQYNPDDICLILYTSGTTGLPKGVVYRYKKSSVQLMGLGAHVFLKSNDVFYTPYALAHGNALLATTTMTLSVGATLALSRKFSASRFWDDIRKYNVTVFNTIGSIIPILMKQPPNENDRNHKVRYVNSSACPADMWDDFENRFGICLYELYGAIDGGGKGIFNLGTAPVGSLGKPPFLGKYRIVNEKGHDVRIGSSGELLFEVKAEKSRIEYYKNPDASQKKSGDGWIHTGDSVKQDRYGYLYFVGRNTESMRRGGENVSAYEVEQVIMSHPSVEEVAVYGVPSDLAEDEIMAAVKLVEPKSISAEDLCHFLQNKLAKYAIPRYYRFVDDFSKTNSHRIIKHELEKKGITSDTVDMQKKG
ncbi:MAG: AMP-binding protein [Desulfobacterales bacterium]|nr:AMP-binding protein [Desulfobacterales bacterium]